MLARRAIQALQSEWERLAQARALQPADIEEAIWERYSRLVEDDDRFRSNLPMEADLDDVWRELERQFGEFDITAFRIYESIKDMFDEARIEHAARLKTLRAHVARGETASIADVLKDELSKRRLDASSAIDMKRLASVLQRAEIEALSRGEERDAGVVHVAANVPPRHSRFVGNVRRH